jgi:hypothetical protein
MRALATILGLFLSATACAPVTGISVESPAPRPGVLTAADLWPFANVAQAILTLRREWFSGRPVNPDGRSAVFIDGVLTNFEVLASLPTHYVREIRYLTAQEAHTRFGIGQRAGAVMVISR